jgi:glycosyltransferase involved in cell wall biosynthesis
MTPYFSVVTTVYNKAHFVKSTIESILEQSFSDFELLIVDDGSSDNSLEILNSIADDRITVYSTKNQGVSKARNYGISKAKGKYIALCDGDDIWLDNHLSELDSLTKAFPNCGIYSTAYEKHYFETYIKAPTFSHVDHPFFGIVEDYFKTSLADSILWTSVVAIPKTVTDKGYIFDDDLGWGEDNDLWIRLACNFKVAFSSKPTAHKKIYAEENHLSLTKNIPNLLKMLAKHKVAEQENPSLKAYLDVNRFMIAMEAKLRGDYSNYKKVKNEIDLKHLNKKLRLLLILPSSMLQLLKRLKFFLLRNQIYSSPFN